VSQEQDWNETFEESVSAVESVEQGVDAFLGRSASTPRARVTSQTKTNQRRSGNSEPICYCRMAKSVRDMLVQCSSCGEEYHAACVPRKRSSSGSGAFQCQLCLFGVQRIAEKDVTRVSEFYMKVSFAYSNCFAMTVAQLKDAFLSLLTRTVELEARHLEEYRAGTAAIANKAIKRNSVFSMPRGKQAKPLSTTLEMPKDALSSLHSTCLLTASKAAPRKHALVRAIIFVQYGFDFAESPVPFQITGVAMYAVPPPTASGGAETVKGNLYRSLLDVHEQHPHFGLGLAAHPYAAAQNLLHSNSSLDTTYGLCPHIVRHLSAEFTYFVADRSNVAAFGRHFVGGIEHWKGNHPDWQCRRGKAVCEKLQRGVLPPVEGAEEALREILVRISKQYAGDGALYHSPPHVKAYDPSMEATSDDWFNA